MPASIILIAVLGINPGFCTKSIAQDKLINPQIESLIKALEHAKKPADNFRFQYTKERKSGFSAISATLETDTIKQVPYTHSLLDYTVTISGIRSRIDRETKKVNKETDSEPFDITRSIEVRDGTFCKELRYKPDQNDIPLTGIVIISDSNHSDMSYFAYGWPGDITKAFLYDPSVFRLIPSEEPDIYIIEFKDAGTQRVYIDSQKNFNIVKWQIRKSDDIVICELNYEFKQTEDGIWYPCKYQRINSPILPNGEQSPPTIEEIARIHNAEFDIDIPEDTFELEFPAGTKVIDNVIGGKYIVSDSNSP